jgi:hypothetical protein
MGETPVWPAYPVGPRDSIFAIGVASIKYTELESVLRFMFATVFDVSRDDAMMLVSKMGAAASVTLMQRKLPSIEWTDTIKEHVTHFIEAFGICSVNRNSLLHSELAWIEAKETVLFKMTKKGSTDMAVPSLGELRQVADDMNTYCNYGRQLGNAINNTKAEIPVFPVSAFPWPSKPPLPRNIPYSSGPHPV